MVLLASAGAPPADGRAARSPASPGDKQGVWLVRLAPGASADERPSAASPAASGAASRARAWAARAMAGHRAAADLAPMLADLAKEGRVEATELLPAARVLAVTGDAEAARRLARTEGVLGVVPNRRHRLPSSGLDVPSPASRADHLAQAGAPAAWRLGATGAGAVVGLLDSGVDWRHPALADGYRGRDGHHDHAWADLVDGARGSREPIDPNGHGTHVAGLAVGHDASAGALGVAPGAEWVAVRVFDGLGETTDLALLRGGEWLLAPTDRDGRNPRPELAPDVVNASWNLDSGADPLYEPLLAAWRAAGIVAVFAAGNNDDATGSYGTVRAPGSSALALSVGAIDARGAIWPLSRGGPTWDGRLKPDLVAPGVAVVSSAPGGGLEARSGTSMATPLVAGAAALLRGAAPWLGPEDVGTALRRSAADRGAPGPDPVFGYGALDAGAAVARALSSGRIGGRVVDAAGMAIAGAEVAAERVGDVAAQGRTGGEGAFELLVPAGTWTLRATAPGTVPATRSVTVAARGLALTELALEAGGGGRLAGRLRGRDGVPLAGTVAAVEPAPVGYLVAPGVAADPEGRYALELPAGRHVVRFAAAGHRAVTATVEILPGRVVARDANLPRTPTILLVDADAWQAERIWPYLARGLADAGYPFSVWTIDDPRARTPSATDLGRYDLVWWAHLFGSPGQLDRRRGDRDATEALADFAAAGGRLLVSGQDVGAWDAEDGFASGRLAPAFYRDVLGGRFVADRAVGSSAAGRVAPLQGVVLDLEDPFARRKDGRQAPDVVAPTSGALALMAYVDGRAAAIGSTGDGGRRAYLAFGPESAGGRAMLARLVDRVVGWLEVPEATLVGPVGVVPGDALTATLTVRAGRGGGTVDVRLAAPAGVALGAPDGWRAVPEGLAWQGDLAPEERRAWAIRATVAGAAPAGAATLAATVIADAHRQVLRHELFVAAPDLAGSTLALDPAEPAPGEPVRARLVVRNHGAAAAAVEAEIGVPPVWQAGTPPVDATAGEATWDGGAARWRGRVEAGGAMTLTARGVLSAALGAAVSVRAAVTPALGAPIARAVTVTLGASRPVVAGPLRVPATADAGGELVLEIPLANPGLLPADALLRLALPDGVDAVDPPRAGDEAGWTVRIGAVATVTATVRLRVDPQAPAGLRRFAVRLGPKPDAGQDPEDAVATVLIRAPDLSASTVRFEPGVPRGGRPLTITLRLVNAGDVGASVFALDALPPSLTVPDDAVTVTGGVLRRAPGLVEWRVDVPAGEVETLILRARLGSALGPNARVPHAWRIETPAGTRVLSDTLLADPLTLAGSTLEHALGAARPGGMLRYRLVVAADGTVDARDAVARVDLPDAFDVVAASPGLVASSARELVWRGRLAPGERRPLEIDVRLGDGVADGLALPMRARLTAVGVAPLVLEERVAVALAGPRVAVAASSAMALPGERLRFDVRLTGGERAEAVALSVPLPAGLAPVPGSERATIGPAPSWRPDEPRLTWSGTLGARQAAVVSFAAVSSLAPGARATCAAGLGDALGRALDEAWVDVRGARARLLLPAATR